MKENQNSRLILGRSGIEVPICAPCLCACGLAVSQVFVGRQRMRACSPRHEFVHHRVRAPSGHTRASKHECVRVARGQWYGVCDAESVIQRPSVAMSVHAFRCVCVCVCACVCERERVCV